MAWKSMVRLFPCQQDAFVKRSVLCLKLSVRGEAQHASCVGSTQVYKCPDVERICLQPDDVVPSRLCHEPGRPCEEPHTMEDAGAQLSWLMILY